MSFTVLLTGRVRSCGRRLTPPLHCFLSDVRGKFDVARIPPWKRWPKGGLTRLHPWRLPEVEPPFDLLACDDPEQVAGAISQVVPWKRRWSHHQWLHAVCGHVRKLLPDMASRDIVRIILAFGELYSKRKTHTLLFHDFETFTQLFQALPVDEAATEKSLLPLVRSYRRMGISHEPFVHAACRRVVSGDVELPPDQLSELVRLHGDLKLKSPRLFAFVAESVDLRFAYFSEDQIGDLARTFCALRYRCPTFLATLRRELPFRLHEYAWWNLIDIAEMYLDLEVHEPDIVERIGNEVFKLVLSMKYQYPAKAFKVLAFLDIGDKRTFRLLLRNLPRVCSQLSPQTAAEAIMACVAVQVEPKEVYHRLRGERVYMLLVQQLLPNIGSLSAKMTCDVLAALAKAGQRASEFMHKLEDVVIQRPYKFHAEHLVSLLRDLAALRHPSTTLREMLLLRKEELAHCTPSALCAVPEVLAGHPRRGEVDEIKNVELQMLSQVSELLCKPGAYSLPSDGRVFRSKDEFWWKQLRQRHFRLRRKAAAAGASVNPAPQSADSAPADQLEINLADAAVAHISRQECLQLVSGCAKLDWRDEALLQGVTLWLCSGRRHAELEAEEVALLLGAFSDLGFAQPLLRSSLEHALLRVSSFMPPACCTKALQGALDVGMAVRGSAVRSLLRRCGSQLPLLPPEDAQQLRTLAALLLNAAESEVLAESQVPRGLPASVRRLPVDLHLFREAIASKLGPSTAALTVPGMQ